MANTPVINNFNAGEFSPFMYGRNDLKKYFNACLTVENMQTLPYGGATRRPALKYVAESKAGGRVALVDFLFSTEESYCLEFGENYIRFYRDGEQILDGGVPYEIATVYGVDDIQRLRYTQSADVMWLVDGVNPPQRLSRFGDTDWTIADEALPFPLFRSQNVDETKNVIYTAGTGSDVGDTGTIDFNTDTLNDPLHIGSYWQIRQPKPEISLTSLAVGSTPPTDLTNSLQASAGDKIGLLTSGANTGTLRIWRTADHGETWEQFRFYQMTDRNVDTSWDESENDVYYKMSSTGVVAQITLTINEAYTDGVVQITSITNEKIATVVVTSRIEDEGVATYKYSEGAWSDLRGYPKAIALWETRLIYGGTISDPRTLWLSTVDDFNNFNQTSLDDGAFTLTLGSGRVDDIRWMVQQQQLIIGTAGSEWVLEAESDNKPVTPTEFSLKRKTTYGSTGNVDGLLVNSAVLFVMRQGRKVREFTYQFEQQDFVAPDLTILAEHVTKGGIQSLVLQQQPDNNVFCIRGDGQLATLTYERDQDVTGWQRWNNDEFEFESVQVLPRDDNEDEVYASVKIEVDGETKRYIGIFDNREWGDDIRTEWNGSDLYIELEGFDISGWQNVTVANSTDDLNGAYAYSEVNDRLEGPTGTITELADTWEMTDGVDTYTAEKSPVRFVPNRFIASSTSTDSSEAGLFGEVPWKERGDSLNGQAVYLTLDEEYARWFNGEVWLITDVSDIAGEPDDYFVALPESFTGSFTYFDETGPQTYNYNGTYVIDGVTDTPSDAYYSLSGSGASAEINNNISEWKFQGDQAGAVYTNATTGILPPKTLWKQLGGSAGSAERITYNPTPISKYYGQGSFTGVVNMPVNPVATVSPNSTIVTGLDHLEGKIVKVLRDGSVDPSRIVSGGEIEVQKLGNRLSIGLHYRSVLAPMYFEPVGDFKQPVGKHKGVFKAVVRFKDTVTAQVGRTLDSLERVEFRTTSDDFDKQVDLFSGEKKVNFNNRYEFLHTCHIVQDEPLPMTVIALVPWVEVRN